MVEGLLSFLKTPEGQGLLGAAAGYASGAQRGTPWNNAGRGGLAGLLAYGQAGDRQLKQQEEAQQRQVRDLQLQTGNMQLGELLRKKEDDQAARAVLMGVYGQGGMPQAGGPTNAVNAALPQDFQIGALPATAAYQQQNPGGKADVFARYKAVGDKMAANGLTTQAREYYELAEKYRPKYSTTPQPMMVGGRLTNVLISEDGTHKTMDGVEVKPDMVEQDLGGTKQWTDKNKLTNGQTFIKTMTPDGKDASARGWASNNLAERQFNNTVAQQSAPQFQDGVWVTRPTQQNPQGSATAIPGFAAAKNAPAELQKVIDAKGVLDLLNEADTLLPKSTNSWAGAGVDVVAGAFGKATDGAKAGAQLKAIQGALVSKMPKMSGPQSDKDVQLYREMAGQIGDPTIPYEIRQEASNTIRKLNEKYAGVPEGSSRPTPPSAAPAGAPTLRWDPKTRTLKPVG